jgi:glutathione S-transferase
MIVYGNFISQPSRAVLWALAMKGISYKFVKVDPSAGDCERPDYLSKFPCGTAPALEDGKLCITEGLATLQP